jgi:CBS domain-containing protein
LKLPCNQDRLDSALYRFLQQTVGDYMTRTVKAVKRQMPVHELSRLFERDDFNTYPVEEDGQVVGLVTKFDLLRCFAFTPSQMVPRYDDLMNRTVADIMTPTFIYVGADTRLTRVLQLMIEHKIRSIPAMENDNRLVGIIAREDVIRALAACAEGDK